MRRSAAAVVSVAWGVALGGTFGCLLPYLLGYWHFHRPLPYWTVAQAAGGLLICAGLVPIVHSFTDFIRADGTPVPVASPPRLVVSGSYRYVRNPIYVGFVVILAGQALLFGSPGLLVYTAVAWCISAAAVRFYEEPSWPANSEPSTRITGAPCGPGFPGCVRGRPAGRPERPGPAGSVLCGRYRPRTDLTGTPKHRDGSIQCLRRLLQFRHECGAQLP